MILFGNKIFLLIRHFGFWFCLFLSVSFQVDAQSLLYSVGGNGMKNPIYIFGTIHALPAPDFFIDKKVDEKFFESEFLVLEIDMSSPSMLSEIQMAMIMNGTTLDSLVTSQEYEKLKQFFADSLMLPLDFIKQIKPMMMTSFLLPKVVGVQTASYETFFLQRAVELQKSVKGIETVAEQVGYLDMIPLKSQAKMLLQTIDDFNASRIEFRNLVDAYKTRDVENVYKIIMETSDEYKEFGKYLIDTRNQNWIPRIIEFGNMGTCFIAVGCGHLGGEMGVLNLLRKNGFEVVEILDE